MPDTGITASYEGIRGGGRPPGAGLGGGGRGDPVGGGALLAGAALGGTLGILYLYKSL